MNDVITLLKKARPELPLFFYSHSLGGLTTIKLLLNRPELNVSGCIVTSPLLGFPKDRHFPWVKKFFIKLVGDHLEDIIVNSMVNPTALTKNNKFIQTIFEDRLMIPFLSVRMGKSILCSVEEVMGDVGGFRFPIVIFHGKKDSVTNYEDSKTFIYTKLTAYKQIHLFENGYHEMQHDEERDEILTRGLQFINSLPESLCRSLGTVAVKPFETRKKSSPMKSYLIIAAVVALVALYKYLKMRKAKGG